MFSMEKKEDSFTHKELQKISPNKGYIWSCDEENKYGEYEIDDYTEGKVSIKDTFGKDASKIFSHAVINDFIKNNCSENLAKLKKLDIRNGDRTWFIEAMLSVALSNGTLLTIPEIIKSEKLNIQTTFIIQVIAKLHDRIYCITESSGNTDRMKEEMKSYSELATFLIKNLSKEQIKTETESLVALAYGNGFYEILFQLIKAGAPCDKSKLKEEPKFFEKYLYFGQPGFYGEYCSLGTYKKCDEILEKLAN